MQLLGGAPDLLADNAVKAMTLGVPVIDLNFRYPGLLCKQELRVLLSSSASWSVISHYGGCACGRTKYSARDGKDTFGL